MDTGILEKRGGGDVLGIETRARVKEKIFFSLTHRSSTLVRALDFEVICSLHLADPSWSHFVSLLLYTIDNYFELHLVTGTQKQRHTPVVHCLLLTLHA